MLLSRGCALSPGCVPNLGLWSYRGCAPIRGCNPCLNLCPYRVKSKVVHLYSAFFHVNMLKDALQWSGYPQRTGSVYTKRSMYAGTHFTDPGRMESWVNFSGKKGSPKYSTLDLAGDRTRDLRIGRQRSLPLRQPLRYTISGLWSLLGVLPLPGSYFLTAIVLPSRACAPIQVCAPYPNYAPNSRLVAFSEGLWFHIQVSCSNGCEGWRSFLPRSSFHWKQEVSWL